MRGLSLVPVVLSVAVMLSVSGCSDAGSSSAAPSPGATTGSESNASCPVTTPSQGQVPTTLQDFDGRWHGTDGLWLDLWFVAADSSLKRTDDGVYRLKYGTVTLHEGAFTSQYGPPRVRAHRLDGSGTARTSTGDYAHEGKSYEFWPTTFEFPSRGCWRVTTSWRDTTVTFTLQVPR